MAKYLTQSKASLYLDGLLLTGRTTDTDGNVFTIEAQDDNASFGAPQPIEVAVQRWMTDGAVAATQGFENREISFQVKVAASTSAALAYGEATLVSAARSASTVAWTPPEGSALAATTVFDVWTCYLAPRFNPDEENRLTRTYTVTATAKPWARSEDLTTAAANPTAGAGTVTSVDTCTSTTNWTGSPNTPTVFGGTAIRESGNSSSAGAWPSRTLTRTASVTGMGTTPYLALDVRATGSAFAFPPNVSVDGAGCTFVGTVNTTRYYQVPAGVTSFTTLTIKSTHNPVSKTTTITLDVYDVTKTSVVAPTSTHKMLGRNIETGGSVPTSGSIQIASPSATVLGNTLVYTGRDAGNGYSPPLRQYRNAGISTGTDTVDATMVSGTRTSTGTTYFDIPAGVLREATYAVVSRLSFTGAGTATISFGNTLPGTTTTINGGLDVVTTSVTGSGAGVKWAILGTLSAPGVGMPPESTVSSRIFSTISGTGSPVWDELFLLDVTHGAFSLVTSVTGFTFTKLWLDSPDVDSAKNRPQVYYGTAADRSDALQLPSSQILSIGDHDLDPGGAFVFTVTDGVDDAVVTATYFWRWHTHAAA